MFRDVLFYVAISEAVSLFLIIKLWARREHWLLKLTVSVVTLVPFLGPFLYMFAMDDTKPQSPRLQNRGPRGDYTHDLISLKPLIKDLIDDEKKRLDDGQDAKGKGAKSKDTE